MSISELKKLPFYSWNCLTIQLPHRFVDIVIKNEQHMKLLIKFLVYKMKTIDGNKNTALSLLNHMNQ